MGDDEPSKMKCLCKTQNISAASSIERKGHVVSPRLMRLSR